MPNPFREHSAFLDYITGVQEHFKNINYLAQKVLKLPSNLQDSLSPLQTL
jgi:hypothetical protein